MAWVVDTSVLLDIHLGDPTFGDRSGQCLMRYLLDGLVICPVSYIELAPAFGGDSSLQQAFLQEAGVDWLQPWTFLDTVASYQLWANHIAKKRAGRGPKRPVADILIEGFTQRFRGIITRNPKHFSTVATIAP
jgi:predicted nucleic acid-binding protein